MSSSAASSHESRTTLLVVFATLIAIYAATLAPGVTLWDAGEFQAAIASLGIPHPPGTPLYIVLGSAWSALLGFVPLSLAMNLFSAVATAIACGLLGGLMTRWTGRRLTGIASGIAAGSMMAVWYNATETEIYALSLLLAVLMIVVGDLAGTRNSGRLRVLLAFLMSLAVPIQISALIAAPAAIVLAATGPGETRPKLRTLFTLGSILVIVGGAGLASLGIVAAGTVLLLVSVTARGGTGAVRREAAGFAAVVVLGLSATLFMLVRARHDPFINQGNPSTVPALIDVVARNQYPLPGLWPRKAPAWVQALNFVQYADWQVASGLDDSVAASWRRTPWSLLAFVLVILGARDLRRRNHRAARATAVLFVMASLGVITVLNLRAGPSILDSVLPPGALHEPRERDYFFALAFATMGVLLGAGAVAVATRRASLTPRAQAALALAIAALPVALNWRAATRHPDGMVADTYGEALLASVPPNALLLTAGDNDSYTVWYRQSALRERRDVVPVTIPLLPARWYREELERRHGFFGPSIGGAMDWRGEPATLKALVEGARARNRPIAVSLSVSTSVRERLAAAWTLGGMVYTADSSTARRADVVDTASTARVAALIASRLNRYARGRDPGAAYVVRVLNCPSQALRLGSGGSGPPSEPSLDSRCNFK